MAVSSSGEFEDNSNSLILFWLDDLVCDGTETFLSACPHSTWGEHDCLTSSAAGLTCSGSKKFYGHYKFFEFKIFQGLILTPMKFV